MQLRDASRSTRARRRRPAPAPRRQLPNAPGFDAGTVSPISKNYSPFVLHLRREDGTQQLLAVNAHPAAGPDRRSWPAPRLCPDGALAAAAAKSGRAEQASPSCPLASRVGSVSAGAGAGPSPYYVHGQRLPRRPLQRRPASASP